MNKQSVFATLLTVAFFAGLISLLTGEYWYTGAFGVLCAFLVFMVIRKPAGDVLKRTETYRELPPPQIRREQTYNTATHRAMEMLSASGIDPFYSVLLHPAGDVTVADIFDAIATQLAYYPNIEFVLLRRAHALYDKMFEVNTRVAEVSQAATPDAMAYELAAVLIKELNLRQAKTEVAPAKPKPAPDNKIVYK